MCICSSAYKTWSPHPVPVPLLPAQCPLLALFCDRSGRRGWDLLGMGKFLSDAQHRPSAVGVGLSCSCESLVLPSSEVPDPGTCLHIFSSSSASQWERGRSPSPSQNLEMRPRKTHYCAGEGQSQEARPVVLALRPLLGFLPHRRQFPSQNYSQKISSGKRTKTGIEDAEMFSLFSVMKVGRFWCLFIHWDERNPTHCAAGQMSLGIKTSDSQDISGRD